MISDVFIKKSLCTLLLTEYNQFYKNVIGNYMKIIYLHKISNETHYFILFTLR